MTSTNALAKMNGPAEEVEVSAGTRALMARSSTEVQAAVFMAKQFPRDEKLVRQRVLAACASPVLAEEAEYEYPRGGERITGASIRLAEAMILRWGNADYGWAELERRPRFSAVQAFAWDFESNVRRSIKFDVPHVRETKERTYAVTSERDLYEVLANQSARRMRQCILGLLPLELVEEAVLACRKTLELKNKGEPMAERMKKFVAYLGELGVGDETTVIAKLEKKLGHNVDAISENEYLRLRRLAASVKDNMVAKDDAFPSPTAPAAPVEEPKKSTAERMKEELAAEDAQAQDAAREPGSDDDKDTTSTG